MSTRTFTALPSLSLALASGLFLLGSVSCQPEDVELDAPSLSFPQAIGGALLWNPVAFPDARFVVETNAKSAVLEVGRVIVESRVDGDDLVFTLPLLDDGLYTAKVTSGQSASDVELLVSRSGVQVTDFAMVGAAATPRLHQVDGRLLLTWADRRQRDRRAFIVELDGKGAFVGEPTIIGDDDGPEVQYARVVVRGERVYMLYQTLGGPYENHFLVADLAGEALFGPIALDPEDRLGSFGGSLAYDGGGVVVTFRTNQGSGQSVVHWARFDDVTMTMSAPELVGQTGDAGRGEGFEPFTFLSIAADTDGATLAFARKEFDVTLDFAVPVARFVGVDPEGHITAQRSARTSQGFLWQHDARVLQFDDEAIAVWTESDLSSSEANAPVSIMGGSLMAPALVDVGPLNRRALVSAPGHRGEVNAAGKSLVWLDERTLAGPDGKIQLMFAELEDLLSGLDEGRVIDHAVFIAGTSQLGGVEVGAGDMVTWIDERHGSGLFDPRPEVWLEMLWR